MIYLILPIAVVAFIAGRCFQCWLEGGKVKKESIERHIREVTPFTEPRSAGLYDFPAKDGRRLRIVGKR